MTNLKKLLIRLAKDDSGQDLIEYALIAALLALGAAAGMKTLSTEIGTVFTNVTASLSSAI